jgi:hypothetical protein
MMAILNTNITPVVTVVTLSCNSSQSHEWLDNTEKLYEFFSLRFGNKRPSYNQVNPISFQAYFGLYALVALVPIIHLFSQFNWKDRTRQWLNRSLDALLLLLFINAFVLEAQLKNRLSHAGYRYCQALSEQMTFSEFSTYLDQNLPCQKQ